MDECKHQVAFHTLLFQRILSQFNYMTITKLQRNTAGYLSFTLLFCFAAHNFMVLAQARKCYFHSFIYLFIYLLKLALETHCSYSAIKSEQTRTFPIQAFPSGVGGGQK